MQTHFPLHFTARKIGGQADLTRIFTRTCRNECSQYELYEICRALRKLPYITAAFVVDGYILVSVTEERVWDNPSHYPHQRIERLAQFLEDQRHSEEQQLHTRRANLVPLDPEPVAVAA